MNLLKSTVIGLLMIGLKSFGLMKANITFLDQTAKGIIGNIKENL